MQENTNPVGYSTAVIKKINDKVNDKLNLDIKEVSPLKNVDIVESKINIQVEEGMSWFQIIFIIIIIICVVYLLYKYFFKTSSNVTIEKSDSVEEDDDE